MAYISFGFRVLRWTWNMGVHKGIPKSGSSKYRCFGSLDCFFLDISHRLKIETTHIFVNLAKKMKKTGPPTQDQPKCSRVSEFFGIVLWRIVSGNHMQWKGWSVLPRGLLFFCEKPLARYECEQWPWTQTSNLLLPVYPAHHLRTLAALKHRTEGVSRVPSLVIFSIV